MTTSQYERISRRERSLIKDKKIRSYTHEKKIANVRGVESSLAAMRGTNGDKQGLMKEK